VETQIPWNKGEGVILAVYSGSGDGALHLSSSTPNEGLDREQKIQVAACDAPLDVEVTVRQPGMREAVLTADAGEPELITSDGLTYAVLKS